MVGEGDQGGAKPQAGFGRGSTQSGQGFPLVYKWLYGGEIVVAISNEALLVCFTKRYVPRHASPQTDRDS